MNDLSDVELVRRSRAGDNAAFSCLLARHEAQLRRLLHSVIQSGPDVDDIVQESLLQAYLSIDNLRQPERFRAWLIAIALNMARGLLRERYRRAASFEGGPEADIRDTRPQPEQWVQQRETQAGLERALAELPDAEREAITLVYREGLTHQETARRLGVSLSAVKVRVHRGRRRLRTALQGDYARATSQTRSDRRKLIMIPVIVYDVLTVESSLDPRAALAPQLEAMPEATREPFLAGVSLSLEPRRTLGWGMHRSPDPSLTLTDEEQRAYEGATRGLWPHHIVLLKETEGERALPIWIGPVEAASLAAQLISQQPLRPLTADLMTTLLQLAGLRVERVVIGRLHEEVFYATITAHAPKQTSEIDCRPSDAINLAVRLDAPLFVAEEVMAEAGVVPNGGSYPLGKDESQMLAYSLVHEQ